MSRAACRRAKRPTEATVLAALRELHSADPLALAERGPKELAEALSTGGFVRRRPAVDDVAAACEVLAIEAGREEAVFF